MRPPFAARRPLLTIAAACVVLVALAGLGSSVDSRLAAPSLEVPGTESSRGLAMLRQHFGESAPYAVLIQGPRQALDRQGPQLIAALRHEPEVTVLSPWDRSEGVETLRPNARTVVALVDVRVSPEIAMTTTTPRLERLIEADVRAPVRARVAGVATVARAIRDESIEVTRRGETILAPIMLLVLLAVFRSPVAALIPLIFGGTTLIAARGLVSVLASLVDISGFALSIGTMIGLAVGVDYALLIVSRFREELDHGATPLEAATLTRSSAGRTIVFAGSILVAAVLIAVCLVPGALLLSLGAAVVPAIVVAVLGPWLVGPAILVLLGHRVNRWRIGGSGPRRMRWLSISRGALRQPRVAAAAITVLLVAIALPAVSLRSGPVTIAELSPDDPARLNVEAIEDAIGSGWIAPAVVVAVDEQGPITGPRQLVALDRWQSQVGHQPGVEAVIGPGRLARQVAPLQKAGRRFLAGGEESGGSWVTASLQRAGTGISRLRRGLAAASEGALRLQRGGGRAQTGATLIARGLTAVAAGSQEARRALRRFSRGVRLLAGGERSALLGTSLLDFGVGELGNEVGDRALRTARQLERRLRTSAAQLPTDEAAVAANLRSMETAWRELNAMTVDASDPHYVALERALREALATVSGRDPVTATPYAPGFGGLAASLPELGLSVRASLAEAKQLSGRLIQAKESVAFLRRLCRRLKKGTSRLQSGSDRLIGGANRILRGVVRVGAVLRRLAGAGRRLAAGLGRLKDGNALLARRLSFGFRRSRPLIGAARRAQAKVTSVRHHINRGSPHIFDSGYFVLSALDGSPPPQRQVVQQAVDLEDGGQAAKVLVVSAGRGPDPLAMSAETNRLRKSARQLAATTGLRVAVTGGVAESIDYQRSTTARLLPLVVAITVITFLVMVTILRGLPLAVIAIALNLLTVADAFGVLALLTRLPASWPLGGVSRIDPVSAAGIFGVVFGLSIDYAVFLLMRMREGWERTDDAGSAIWHGLERTAGVITGAATIMTFVFLIFATAPIQSVSQFGVSLTVAVVLDATVVRLMLLPVLMKLTGPAVWWLPGWLDRALPRLKIEDASWSDRRQDSEASR